MTPGMVCRLNRRVSASDGGSSRSRLLYGQWTLRDGTEVLFDRKYRPKWCRKSDDTVSPADPTQWIDDIVQAVWFYTDRCSLPDRKQINAQIVAEWRLP
jgi:hypothetical protein